MTIVLEISTSQRPCRLEKSSYTYIYELVNVISNGLLLFVLYTANIRYIDTIIIYSIRYNITNRFVLRLGEN